MTVECNPNNVREARLAGYRAAGVNRLSLGVQSMDDAELRLLGRQHTAARVGQAVATARAAGFDDLSLDLMYRIAGPDAGGLGAHSGHGAGPRTRSTCRATC